MSKFTDEQIASAEFLSNLMGIFLGIAVGLYIGFLLFNPEPANTKKACELPSTHECVLAWVHPEDIDHD